MTEVIDNLFLALERGNSVMGLVNKKAFSFIYVICFIKIYKTCLCYANY